MQGAGITPEAVPRKGREERNTGDRQRDSKGVVAGLRNATLERAWWFLASVPDETEGRNDGDGKKRWCHRGGVW